jgi:hypothetical protein
MFAGTIDRDLMLQPHDSVLMMMMKRLLLA